MPFKCPDELMRLRVPEVDNALVGPRGKVLAAIPRPADRSDQVFVLGVVVQLRHLGATCRPNVDLLGEADSKEIVVTPIH